MTTTIAAKRRHWWTAVEYEVSMLRGLRELRRGSQLQGVLCAPSEDPGRIAWLLDNIITEGLVLHTRNLCEFCCTPSKQKEEKDIKPSDLFDNYSTDPKYDTLRGLMERLTQQYGKNKEGDVRWAFNKKFAHLTKERGEGVNYTPFLNRVFPVLDEIIGEIEALREHLFPVPPSTIGTAPISPTGPRR